MNVVFDVIDRVKCFVQETIVLAVSHTFGLLNIWLKHHYDGSDVRHSDVIVVLTAKYDHNGALSLPHPINTFQLHNFSGAKIVYKTVSSIADINNALQLQKVAQNRIKGLHIHAHGNASGFALDEAGRGVVNFNFDVEEKHFGKGNALRLKESLQLLEEDAVIVFESCLTARIDATGNRSIAQTLASLAPGRRVYAPTKVLSGFGTQFHWENGSFEPHFTTPKTVAGSDFWARATNLFYEMLFIYSIGYFGDNMTAVHREYTTPPRVKL